MMNHVSVMSTEVLDYSKLSSLDVNDSDSILGLDVTLGLGGHSRLLLQSRPNLKLFAIDKDNSTRKIANESLSQFKPRFNSYHLCFSKLNELEDIVDPAFSNNKSLKFDLIIADLGVSSAQLDDPQRGLSYRNDSALDMRLDQTQKLTADMVLNDYSERDLFLVFARGGVGGLSKALAKAIVSDRPIMGTKDFHKICNSVLRNKSKSQLGKRQSDHATVPFQAVRIEVNNEFKALKDFLIQAVQRLNGKGRLIIISFHSLEDKIVAGVMRWWSSVRGKGLHPEDEPLGKLLTKKAIRPSEEEVKSNSRSRSAMLRVFERNSNLVWKERELVPESL